MLVDSETIALLLFAAVLIFVPRPWWLPRSVQWKHKHGLIADPDRHLAWRDRVSVVLGLVVALFAVARAFGLAPA